MLRALREAWADFRAALGSREATAPPREEAKTPPPSPGQEATEQQFPAGDLRSQDVAATSPTPDVPTLPPPFWRRHGLTALLVVAFLGFLGWQYIWPLWAQAEPADRNVVATFTDGVITKEDLGAELERHPEADRRALANVPGLRHLVQDMVVHRVVERWAQERRLEDKSSVQHAIKHVAEDVKLADIGRQVHEDQIRVDESEIQRYYDENRAQLGTATMEEARAAIRETLHASKEQAFIDEYLRSLRQSASVTLDESLLAAPVPAEADLAAFYAARQSEFREPGRRRVLEVRFAAANDREAKDKAEKARARATAGEDFGAVAKEYGGGNWHDDGEWAAKGTRNDAFETAVWALREGEISPIFPDGNDYRLVKVVERRPERLRSFDEVRDEISRRLAADLLARQDEANRDKTLFTIRGRRFTLGEFLDEFVQLTPQVQERYRTPETRRDLVDRLIDRLILLDNASAQMLDVKNKREIEDARRHLLARVLHEEEMQDKVTATEDEVRRFYDAHRSHYIEPAKVKIDYIRVGAGGTEDARKGAQAKLAEAERRVKEGGGAEETFAAVAKEFSEDADTAAKGGQLDRWLVQTNDALTHTLSHNFVENVFRLKPGQVSQVFSSGSSYYLVRLRERTEGKPVSFEQAKGSARQDLLDEKHLRALDEMEAELSRRMRLAIYDGRLQQVIDESGIVQAR